MTSSPTRHFKLFEDGDSGWMVWAELSLAAREEFGHDSSATIGVSRDVGFGEFMCLALGFEWRRQLC